jgi:6-aminohexanoate-oligomer exohydrolase
VTAPDGFDRADWKAPAHAPWAFTHTRDFLPIAEIARGGPVRALASFGTAPPDWLPPLDAVHATSALVVTREGLAAEWYRTPGDGERRHMTFSITKSLIGLLALMLIEKGVLDEAASVEAYAPALAGSAFGAARIGALLAMRDGVPFDERYADPDAAIHRYSRHYWGAGEGGTIAALRALPIAVPTPRFAYRTPVADALGWAIRGATGSTLPELLSERLWQSIGAEDGAHLILDTAGEAIAGTGLNARPRDLARLAMLLLDDGGGVIARAVVDRLFRGGSPVPLPPGYEDRAGWSYDGLWWHMGGARIAALGVHGQRLTIDRDAGVALIVTGAAPRPDNAPYDAAHRDLLDAALAHASKP